MAELGEVLHASEALPLARSSSLDARNAAARALACFLSRLKFRVGGNIPREFVLNEVREEWPNSGESLQYPSAAITEAGIVYGGHNLTPSELEDTLNEFGPGTMLWKTSELGIEFQVDFWTTSKPEREAIAARIVEVFNPGENRTGVVLQGPEEYFNRTVRCTLTEHQRIDTSDTVFANERRLKAIVVADIDVVQLRQVTMLQPVPKFDIRDEAEEECA